MFFSNRRRAFTSRTHAALLRRLAGHIAIAVERTRLIAELREKNRQLAEANKTKDQFLDLLQKEVDRQTRAVTLLGGALSPAGAIGPRSQFQSGSAAGISPGGRADLTGCWPAIE